MERSSWSGTDHFTVGTKARVSSSRWSGRRMICKYVLQSISKQMNPCMDDCRLTRRLPSRQIIRTPRAPDVEISKYSWASGIIETEKAAEVHRSSLLSHRRSQQHHLTVSILRRALFRGDFSSEVLLCFQISAAIKQHFLQTWKDRDNTPERIGIWRKTRQSGLCVCFLPVK